MLRKNHLYKEHVERLILVADDKLNIFVRQCCVSPFMSSLLFCLDNFLVLSRLPRFLSVLLLCCASHLLLPETHLPTRSPLSSAICVSLPLVSRKSSQIVDQRSCFSKFQTRNQANWKVIPKHNKVFFIGGAKKKTCEACM
jgi:hypothetical protein